MPGANTLGSEGASVMRIGVATTNCKGISATLVIAAHMDAQRPVGILQGILWWSALPVSAALFIGIAIVNGIAIETCAAIFDMWLQPVMATDGEPTSNERPISAARNRRKIMRVVSIQIR